MSAIAGLVYFDGRVDREGVARRMLEAMAHRGPDGRGWEQAGGAAFGHLLLHTTPESHLEKLPTRGPQLFTCDARLDSRGAADARPDSAIIFEAWERWGEEAPKYLAGDFAFGIWDEARKSFFGARDQIGVRPFYYFHRPGAFFIFATQIRALFCHPEVPRRLNGARLAQAWTAIHTDQASTYYADIFRVPAAHAIIVTRDGLKLRRYWALDAEREEKFASDEEAFEGFRHHFTNAVRTRLRTPAKLAVELSGGLDSSAVACVARELSSQPVRTYSAIFPDVPQSDERPFIDAVLKQGGFDPVFVRGDEQGPLSPFETFLAYEDEGAYGTNFFLRDALHRAMQRDGVRVFLDGFDGDTTVGHGNLRLAELAAANDWGTFRKELDALCARNNFDAASAARMYAAPALGSSIKKIRAAAPHFRTSAFRLALDSLRTPRVDRALRFLRGDAPSWLRQLPALVDRDFARSIGLMRFVREAEEDRPVDLTERGRLARLISSGSFSFSLERYDYHAAFCGMESRHPFTDLRLIEFSAALPSRFRLSDGFNRWIMRKSLAQTLPPEVAWRAGKGNLTENFRKGLFERNAGVLGAWVDLEVVGRKGLIDVPRVRELLEPLEKHQGRGDEQTLFLLFRVLTSARWVRHSSLNPLTRGGGQ